MRGIHVLTACLLVLLPAVTVAAAEATALPGEEPSSATGVGASAGASTPSTDAGTAEPAAAEAEADTGPATLTTGRAEPAFPYTGKVTADLVNVRSGPGLYYYPLTTLSQGDEVAVVSERGQWLALLPPESVFGLMRKSDLDIGQGGTSAVVTSPEARVYASSPTAERQWCVASILEKNDRVSVLGPDEGDFLRVAPPKDARVYIVSEFVTASEAGAPPADGGETVVPETEAEGAEVNPLIEAFNTADANLKAEMLKEIGRREFGAAAAEYQALLEKADKPYVRKACKQRLAYIEAQREAQEDYLKVENLGQELDERLAEIQKKFAQRRADRDAEETMGGADFVAQGMVRRLEILEGVDYPIKYKLVDQNNQPLVVLKSTEYDLADYVGKIIGVRGSREYLKDWRIYSVTVDDLEVME